MSKTRSPIQYPLAYREPFTVIPIENAVRSENYICLGCHKPLLPRLGQINKHHYAHKVNLANCNPSNALHESAKAAVTQGFLTAMQNGTEYNVSIPCDDCREGIDINLALQNRTIGEEIQAVPGTRSDLVIFKDNREPHCILEIVVTHDIEEKTKTHYKEAGLPTTKIKPTWETLPELLQKAKGEDFLKVDNKPVWCSRCRENQRQANECKAQARRLLQPLEQKQVTHPTLTLIEKDQFGSFLKWRTKQTVNKYAIALASVGFQQQASRPTLFKYQKEGWNIYADLDSTKVMRIWEVNCAPAIYSMGPKSTPHCRECLLERLEKILQYHHLPVRRHFEDRTGHTKHKVIWQ